MLECGIKKNIGCCSPSHEETLNDLMEKEFRMILDFMKSKKMDSINLEFLSDTVELFLKYYDFDGDDLDDE